MDRVKYAAQALITLSALLAACGGGGGAGPVPVPGGSVAPTPAVLETVRGIAATGAALAGARVTAHCGNGVNVQGTTDQSGRFSISLGQQSPSAFPCLLKAESSNPAVTLYSYAKADGSININPLTDLTLTKALGQDPAARFAAFGATGTSIDEGALRDAPQFIESAFESMSAYRTTPFSDLKTPDPFTFAFQVGDDRDTLLDSLAASLKAAGVSYEELRGNVIELAGSRESFANQMYERLVKDKIVPVVTGVSCNTPEVGLTSHVTCKITGTNLSRPSGSVVRTGETTSDIGISISRTFGQLPKSDPNRPFKPSWCAVDPLERSVIFRSTDSDDPHGADPLGVFAEEIEITCLASIDFVEPLFVEVVKRNAFTNPADWDLVQGKSAGVFPTVGLSRASFDNGSPTCTELAVGGVNPIPRFVPVLSVAGQATIAVGELLTVFVTRFRDVSVSDFAPLINKIETNFNDGISNLFPTCNGTLCVGGLTASARLELLPPPPIPAVNYGNLLNHWDELGLASGSGSQVWVHLVSFNPAAPASSVSILASNSTVCPAVRY